MVIYIDQEDAKTKKRFDKLSKKKPKTFYTLNARKEVHKVTPYHELRRETIDGRYSPILRIHKLHKYELIGNIEEETNSKEFKDHLKNLIKMK